MTFFPPPIPPVGDCFYDAFLPEEPSSGPVSVFSFTPPQSPSLDSTRVVYPVPADPEVSVIQGTCAQLFLPTKLLFGDLADQLDQLPPQDPAQISHPVTESKKALLSQDRKRIQWRARSKRYFEKTKEILSQSEKMRSQKKRWK